MYNHGQIGEYRYEPGTVVGTLREESSVVYEEAFREYEIPISKGSALKRRFLSQSLVNGGG